MKFSIRFITFWIVIVGIFFYPLLLGSIPAPLDTVVGLYHPFTDVVWNGLEAGVPFKNFLITDPVRQLIPWRNLAVHGLKSGSFFNWNPYSFIGTPLTANIQSATFYPLNIIFFIFPFLTAWSLLIVLTTFLAGIFMFYYLKELKLNDLSSVIGALAFSFSGFMIAWLEWGTVGHVLLWLPLILLLKEKLIQKFSILLFIILCFSEVSMLLAGHVQTSVYVVLFTSIYLIVRIFQTIDSKNSKELISKFVKKSFPFIVNGIIVTIIVFPQYITFFQFLLLSSRNYDLTSWNNASWFLPMHHLIQFIAPDFFGNPATLNYWGEWNYGEFVGYVGIFPLFLFVLGFIFSKKSYSKFYKISIIILFILLLRNPLSEIPFKMQLPFFGTAQPSRILSITVFCICVLSAYGFDYLISLKDRILNKSLLIVSAGLLLAIIILWMVVLFPNSIFNGDIVSSLQSVSKRNLVLPTLLVFTTIFLVVSYSLKKMKVLLYLLLIITFIDLFRFGHKFLSFSNREYFYPSTKITSFLTDREKPFRIMITDRRIFAPNFSVMYKIEDVSGYDPIYLLRYSQLVNSWQRNEPTIEPGRFNRIVTPERYDSFISDLLNVKYILSLTDIESEKLVSVLTEGETRVYENINVFPRVFLVNSIVKTSTDNEEMKALFELQDNLINTATTQEELSIDVAPLNSKETAEIVTFKENSIVVKAVTSHTRLLVLSDIYYPGWFITINDTPATVYQVDYLLRGVIVPPGENLIEFSFDIWNL